MDPRIARADRVLRIGIAVTVIGMVFTLIAILPLLIPSLQLPGLMWFCSMLTGVGLVIVFVGLAMGSRSRRRRPGA